MRVKLIRIPVEWLLQALSGSCWPPTIAYIPKLQLPEGYRVLWFQESVFKNALIVAVEHESFPAVPDDETPPMELMSLEWHQFLIVDHPKLDALRSAAEAALNFMDAMRNGRPSALAEKLREALR